MVEIGKDEFATLETAIRAAISTACDRQGVKLLYATQDYSRGEIENAAVVALMTLTKSWVRPKGVQFITMKDGGMEAW